MTVTEFASDIITALALTPPPVGIEQISIDDNDITFTMKNGDRFIVTVHRGWSVQQLEGA